MQEVVISIVFFIFGIVFGSFYNVVGYRLPKKMSLIKPGSHCPNCNTPLKSWDLIPILSYLIYKGKCKYCKQKINIFYPTFEFITGILFVTCYLIFGFSINLIISLIFVSACLIIIISDILYMIILDEILVLSILSILIIKIYESGFNFELLLDLVIPFVFMFLLKFFGDKLFKKESLGGGDVKLMSLFGIVLGYKMAIVSVFLSSFIAFPISLYFMNYKKNQEIPFGPYLCVSAILVLFLKIDFNFILSLLLK